MPKNFLKAISLLSGGMDSLVSTAIAAAKHSDLAVLHLNYGQRTEAKELDCFNQIADHYKIQKNMRKIIDASFLHEIGGSSLTDLKIAVPHYSENDSENSTGIPNSYVPFRNTHIISMAVSWAEVIGAEKIYIGAVEEDSPGYPDCRPDYYQAMNDLIRLGTRDGSIQVATPLIHMSKKDIILKARELGAPLELSWSCYQNSHEACGTCDSCRLRLSAFKKAGLKDLIPYQYQQET